MAGADGEDTVIAEEGLDLLLVEAVDLGLRARLLDFADGQESTRLVEAELLRAGHEYDTWVAAYVIDFHVVRVCLRLPVVDPTFDQRQSV